MPTRILLINYPFPFFSSGDERFDYNYGVARLIAYLSELYTDSVEFELKWRVMRPTEDFINECLDWKPDIIGLSCFLWNHSAIVETLEKIRASGFDGIIVLGGPAARFLYMEHNGFGGHPVYAITGGGEIPFAEFVKQFSEGKIDGKTKLDILNLIECRNGEIIEHPPWLQNESLDFLPSPFRTGLLKPRDNDTVMFLEASRGCNRKCSYCFAHNAKIECKFSRFSPEYLVQELLWAVANGVNYIDFLEVSIGRDVEWVSELVDGILAESELDAIRFHFNLHPSELTPALVEQMERLGERVQHIMVGVQSMSGTTAGTMRRHVDMEKLKRNLEAYAGRLPLKVELIAGLPGDTPADLEGAVVDLSAFHVKVVVNRLTVIPGTEYFRRREEYGLVINRDNLYQLVESPGFSSDYLNSLSQRLPALLPGEEERVEYNENTTFQKQDS